MCRLAFRVRECIRLNFYENYNLVLRKPLKTMQWLSLIEEVRKRPYIWESIPSKSRKKADVLWNEVANSLGLDVKICKSRWTQLRNSYTKAKNRLREYLMWIISIERYDPKKNYGPKWLYYKHLQFLDSSLRPKDSNFSLSGIESDEENVEIEIEIELDDNDSDNKANSSRNSENANNELRLIDDNENNQENSSSKDNISQKSSHMQNDANTFYENPDQLMASPIAIKSVLEDESYTNINAIRTQYAQCQHINLESKIPSELNKKTTLRESIKKEMKDEPCHKDKALSIQYVPLQNIDDVHIRRMPVNNSASAKRSRFHNQNAQMAKYNKEGGNLIRCDDDYNTECFNFLNDLEKKPDHEMFTNMTIKIENDNKPDLNENDSSTQYTKFLIVDPESKGIIYCILPDTTRRSTENTSSVNTSLDNLEKEPVPTTTSTITIKNEIEDEPHFTDKDLSNQHDYFQSIKNVHIKRKPADNKPNNKLHNDVGIKQETTRLIVENNTNNDMENELLQIKTVSIKREIKNETYSTDNTFFLQDAQFQDLDNIHSSEKSLSTKRNNQLHVGNTFSEASNVFPLKRFNEETYLNIGLSKRTRLSNNQDDTIGLLQKKSKFSGS